MKYLRLAAPLFVLAFAFAFAQESETPIHLETPPAEDFITPGEEAPPELPKPPARDMPYMGEEEVLVEGTTWRPGERLDYQITFDHIPIGTQAYTYLRAVKLKDGSLALEYETFHQLDLRFFGTAGKAVCQSYYATDSEGKPLYYRLDQSFNETIRYSVNRPLMDMGRFLSQRMEFKDGGYEYRKARGEHFGKKEFHAFDKNFDAIVDFPFLGLWAVQFQFKTLKKGMKGSLDVIEPFERPVMDYFIAQDRAAKAAPRVRRVTWEVTGFEKTGRTKKGKALGIFTIRIPELKHTLKIHHSGRLLEVDNGMGFRISLMAR